MTITLHIDAKVAEDELGSFGMKASLPIISDY